MNKFIIFGLITIFYSLNILSQEISMNLIGHYQGGIYDGHYMNGMFNIAGAEIPAYNPVDKLVYTSNSGYNSIDVIDIYDPARPRWIFSIDCTIYGSNINSVAYNNGTLVACFEAFNRQDNGTVVFFDAYGRFQNSVTVGAQPDMLCFTPDGSKVLVANEGEPSIDYLNDPEGSISIINVGNRTVQNVRFIAFNGQEANLRAQGVRIFGPNATSAKDFEPEYITISQDSRTAYVTLQEANAIAIIDISSATVTSIKPLGFKNYNLIGNGIDASDRDNKIDIKNWPVFGMYLPDGISSYIYNNNTYLVTANEGDSRDYSGFSEEKRISSLNLDPVTFPNGSTLKNNANLGRLKVTSTLGDANGDGLYEALYSFGARSFTIWDANGNKVWDSGDDMEKRLAQINPAFFNSSHDENIVDGRSDDKGPEPEGVTIGKVGTQTYAFIVLERIGGVMVYNISNPNTPTFATYINNRNFNQPINNPNANQLLNIGDLGPEASIFVPEALSPNGRNLLITANEISGSISIYMVNNMPMTLTLANVSVCSGENIQLGSLNVVSGGSGRYSYRWTPADGLNDPTIPNPVYYSANETREYNLEVTDLQNNNKVNGKVFATVIQKPNVILPSIALVSRTRNIQLGLYPNISYALSTAIYSWTDKEGWTSNLQNPVRTFIRPTTVYLTVSNGVCASPEKSFIILPVFKKDFSTSDDIVSIDNLFDIYPNPAENEIYLSTDLSEDKNIIFTINNLLGEEVYSGVFNEGLKIDISGLSNGIYNIVFNVSGQFITKRFIKK